MEIMKDCYSANDLAAQNIKQDNSMAKKKHKQRPWGRLSIKMPPYRYRDPMLKIRRSRDSFIFNVRKTTPGKDGLNIEMGPCFRYHLPY